MAVDKLASEHFKRTQGASRHVVVDFYADRRGPCRQVAPALEELSSKWDGEVRFVKVNIDESPQLTATYRIFSIPTIILFQNGTVAAQTLGARSASSIEPDLERQRAYPNGNDKHTPYCA